MHLDLNPLLARDKINLQRDYALIGTEVWCGKTYAMPMDADPNAVFYNKTMLLKNGLRDPWADGKGDWSLDEMIEMARKVTQDTDRDGKIDQWGIAWAYTHPSHVAQFVWTKGGDIADFGNMKYILDQPASLDAHQQVYNWLVKDKLIISNAETTADPAAVHPHQSLPHRAGRLPRAGGGGRAPERPRDRGLASSGTSCPSPSSTPAGPASRWSRATPTRWSRRARCPKRRTPGSSTSPAAKGQEVLARTQSLPGAEEPSRRSS